MFVLLANFHPVVLIKILNFNSKCSQETPEKIVGCISNAKNCSWSHNAIILNRRKTF